MNDCRCFCPGWYYYMDCCGNFWVPYEVPADDICCDCWCWDGCCPPTGTIEPTGPEDPDETIRLI